MSIARVKISGGGVRRVGPPGRQGTPWKSLKKKLGMTF